MATARTMAHKRAAVKLLVLLSGVAALHLLASAFVSPPVSRGESSLRGHTVLAATEEKGGFMQFLKVDEEPDNDIELSPEEYKIALEQEMEAERRKYYIAGKPMTQKNLIVPWKPVNEEAVEKAARQALKKNGILDPEAVDEEEEQDSDVELTLVGGDVKIAWTAGVPKDKVGYIVERKEASQSQWSEIATYDSGQCPQLFSKPYPGAEYAWRDIMVRPSQYSYRVLCKNRAGDLNIVDQKDILVVQPEGIDDRTSIWYLLGVIVVYVAYCTIMRPTVNWD